jgi:hypothetical protein
MACLNADGYAPPFAARDAVCAIAADSTVGAVFQAQLHDHLLHLHHHT